MIFRGIFNTLKRFFKKFSADSARAAVAALFCLLLFSCGSAPTDISADEKVREAADYFARSFPLFIPSGYTVGVERRAADKKDGFLRGRFVFTNRRGEKAEIPPVPFLLTSDGRHLVLGTDAHFGAEDLEHSPIPEFGIAPDSIKNAPTLLISENGRIIAADRIMDTRVDYVKLNMDRISLAGAPVLGSADAKVAIVEYSDFQCPFCGNVAPLLRDILGEYEGEVKLVYKQFPLSFHDWAYKASEASLCFHKQGGDGAFKYFHDEVFTNQKKINRGNHRERFSVIAEGAGLDPQKVLLCMDSGEMRKRIESDLREAGALEVTGTPTFFVDGTMVPNDFALLRKALELRLSPED